MPGNNSVLLHVVPEQDVVIQPPREIHVCGEHILRVGSSLAVCSGCVVHGVECNAKRDVLFQQPPEEGPLVLFSLRPRTVHGDFGKAIVGSHPCGVSSGVRWYCSPLYVVRGQLLRYFNATVKAILTNGTVVPVECVMERCALVPGARAYRSVGYLLPAANVSGSHLWAEDWHKSVLIVSAAVYSLCITLVASGFICRCMSRRFVRRNGVPRGMKPYGLILLVLLPPNFVESKTASFVCRDLTTTIQQEEGRWRVSAAGQFVGLCGRSDLQPLIEGPFGGRDGGINVAPKNECLPYLSARIVQCASLLGVVPSSLSWTVGQSSLQVPLMGRTYIFNRQCQPVHSYALPPQIHEQFLAVRKLINPLAPTLIFLLALCRGQYLIAGLSFFAFSNAILPHIRMVADASIVTSDFALPLSVGYVRSFSSKIATFNVEVVRKREIHQAALVRNYTSCSITHRETIRCYAPQSEFVKTTKAAVDTGSAITWVRCGSDCPRCLLYKPDVALTRNLRCNTLTYHNCLNTTIEYAAVPPTFQQYSLRYDATEVVIAVNGTPYSLEDLQRGIMHGTTRVQAVDVSLDRALFLEHVYVFRGEVYTETVPVPEVSMDTPKMCQVDSKGRAIVNVGMIYRAGSAGFVSAPRSVDIFFAEERGYYRPAMLSVPAPGIVKFNATTSQLIVEGVPNGKLSLNFRGPPMTDAVQKWAEVVSVRVGATTCSTASPTAPIELTVVATSSGRVLIRGESFTVSPSIITVREGDNEVIVSTPSAPSISGVIHVAEYTVMVDTDCVEWAGAFRQTSDSVALIRKVIDGVPLDLSGLLASLNPAYWWLATLSTVCFGVGAVLLLLLMAYRIVTAMCGVRRGFKQF